MKTLNKKLKRIRAGKYKPGDFIIADAKDADMGFGVTAPGPVEAGRTPTDTQTGSLWKNRESYLQAMIDLAGTGLIDITLMSASSAEILHQRQVFDNSAVTPAVRLNDTTDIWMARGSGYRQSPSEAFATTDPARVRDFAKLGLYSITFSNELAPDKANLLAYRNFRQRATDCGFKHFLEVFNPAFDIGIAQTELGFYINDMIIKAVAGQTGAEAPLFLKLQYNGARAMEELAHYDPTRLIPGILGGAKGTTRDTFELIQQAHQAGARVALFGRKINLCESPEMLVKLMRRTVQQSLSPIEAVKAYHEYLQDQGITPQRSLKQDLRITDPVLRRRGD